MQECTDRDPRPLEWKDGEGEREGKRKNFEKFNKFMNDNFPKASLVEKAIAECTWDKRQNEIDAIKCLNRNYSKIIDEQTADINTLKAENEKLQKAVREVLDRTKVLYETGHGVAALEAALGYLDGAMTAPDTKGE